MLTSPVIGIKRFSLHVQYVVILVDSEEEEPRTYIRSIKWLSAALVCLAGLVILPKVLWDAYEGGQLKTLAADPATK